jgi:hypothetical protein
MPNKTLYDRFYNSNEAYLMISDDHPIIYINKEVTVMYVLRVITHLFV